MQPDTMRPALRIVKARSRKVLDERIVFRSVGDLICVDDLSLTRNKLESHHAGSSLHPHCAIIVIIANLATIQHILESIDRSPTQPINKVRQAFDLQAFVQMIVPAQNGRCTPILERPPHPGRGDGR